MLDLTSINNKKIEIKPGQKYEVHYFSLKNEFADGDQSFYCVKSLSENKFLPHYFDTENGARQFVESNSGICQDMLINDTGAELRFRNEILVF